MLHFLSLEMGAKAKGTALMVTLVTFLRMSRLCSPFSTPLTPTPAGPGPQTHTAILNVRTTHVTEALPALKCTKNADFFGR